METFTGSCVYIFTDVNIPDFASEYRIVWIIPVHKNGNQSTNYHVFVWITYLAAFYIFMAIASTGFVEFYSMPMFCYMMLFLAVIGIWIFLDIQAEAWDVETEQHRAELEEQDKKMLQMKVKAMEEQYRKC